MDIALLFLLLSAACSSDNGNGLEAIRFRNSQGEAVTLLVEVADTVAKREAGLAGRESLGANEGMLFVIEERGAGFWMKDTRIPLSAAFISDCGEIVAMADMEPFSLEIHQTEHPYRFGLEVNQGWFAANSIAVGDQVEVPPRLQATNCE